MLESTASWALRFTWPIISFSLFAIYTLLILNFAENIPYNDDLALMSSIDDIAQAPDWLVKCKGLFTFHNEHRIAVPRLVVLLLYYVQGYQINIQSWVIVGNALLFPVLYLLYRTRFVDRDIGYFLPVLFFLLQPMHYELMVWGMASLQNIGVVFLAAVTIYSLIYSENKYTALFLAELAVYTSANGLFVFLVGTALLFYQRNRRNSWVWLGVGLLNAYLYWTGFSVSANAGEGFNPFVSLINSPVTFFSLVGGLVYAQTIPILSLLVGLFLVISILLIGYHRLVKQTTKASNADLFLFGFSSFLFLTVAAISLGRDMNSILLVSRYKLYSLFLLVTLYTLLIDWLTERPGRFYGLLIISILFWLTSYARYTTTFERHSRLLFSHFFNWRYSNRLDISSPSAEQYYSDHWTKLYHSGRYQPPQNILKKSQQVLHQLKKNPAITDSVSQQGQFVVINPIRLPNQEYYAVCRTRAQTTIYPLDPSERYSFLSTHQVTYSASVRASYWFQDVQQRTSIITLAN